MAAFDGLRKLIGRTLTARIVSPQGVQIGGRLAYPEGGKYLANVKLGYEKNPIVAACVGLMSSTLNEPPLGVLREDGTVNLNHPLAILFRRPNPYQGQADFWKTVAFFLWIKGNCYIRKIRNQSTGEVVGFVPYGDNTVAPELDANGWVNAFTFTSNGVSETWAARDVIHLRNPLYADPLRLYMGLSPIDVVWPKIMTYNELQATVFSLMASNGVTSGILTAPGTLDPTSIASLKKQLEKRRTAKGMDRTEPLVLGNNMDYRPMGLDAERLQATELTMELEAAICAAFRIQPAVIGSSAGLRFQSYNNLQSAYQEFTTLLRVPIWNALEEQLEAGMYPEYPGVQLAFDLSQVQALQPDVDKVIYPVIGEYNASIITQNEARQKLGFDPVEDGEAYAYERIPAGTGPGVLGVASPLPNVTTGTGAPKSGTPEEGGRIKWPEPDAVKYWQAQDDAVNDAAAMMLPATERLIDRAFKAAIRNVKSRRKNPADAIDTEALVAEFMTATEDAREQLLRTIIEQTIRGSGIGFDQVQTFIDDVRDGQTRETQSNLRTSCETLREEVTRITEAFGGDEQAMRSALTAKFEAINEARAAMIARTTSRAQATVVQDECVKGLNDREPDKNKRFVMVWLSRRDADVRESHEALDGRWIERGKSWEQFQPGITKGPGVGTDPAQIVNCRCVMRPTRIADAPKG